MTNLRWPLLALLGGLAVTGCFSATHIPYRGAAAAVARPGPAIDPPPRPHVEPAVVPAGSVRGHDRLRLYRPRPCADDATPRLGATAYLSRAPGPKRWALVLPIWGSSTYPPHKTVRWLLDSPDSASLDILALEGGPDLFDWPAMLAAESPAALLAEVERGAACIDATAEDVRAFLDWIAARPDTDPRQIGLVGFSIGAMVGSLAAGRDERVSTAVFMMGGGHFEQVFATCYDEPRQVRDHARARFGWSAAEFERRVGGPLAAVDPVAVAGSLDPARVLFIDAGNDTCIPPTAREDLWRALGQPERVTLGYDHKSSFLTMTFLGGETSMRRLIDFLDGHLTAGGAPARSPGIAIAAASGKGGATRPRTPPPTP